MKNKTKFLFLFAVLVVVDQISKYFSNNSICNKNIAWNIPVYPGIFYFIWIATITGLTYSFFKFKSYYQKIFLILILSGAISNIIDRLRFGCVVDYIDLKFFPVFNLADVYITLGVIFLIVFNLKKYPPEARLARGGKIPDTKY